MAIIENFAELTPKEQLDFANALVKTINSEKLFTDQTKFKVTGVEAVEMTGGLGIDLELEDTLEVRRYADWACDDREDAEYEKPEDPNFWYTISKDVEKTFKTLAIELEGYTIALEIIDIDVGEITEVEVDTVEAADAGIGAFDYFGYQGYDSRPYGEVEGTLTQDCVVYCGLYVEAIDHFEPEIDED